MNPPSQVRQGLQAILTAVACTALWSMVMVSTLTASAILPGTASADEDRWLDVEVGHSVIFRGERPIGRVLTSDPTVASLKLLEQGQVSILGQSVGSTDLWICYQNDMGNPIQYDIRRHMDVCADPRSIHIACI